MVTRYKPSIIFSDGEWDMPCEDWQVARVAGLAIQRIARQRRSRHRTIAGAKDTRHKHGGYWTTEYTAGMSSGDHPWEESRGMGFSYGYNRAETAEATITPSAS